MEAAPVRNEAQQLWGQWTLFSTSKTYYSQVFEKQIGLLAESQSFSHRSKWQDPPGVINIFESILTGIDTRYKRGLYKNKHRYFMDIQLTLQECLKAYRDHKDIIIDSFQNKTLLTISKEKEPKVVTSCEKCRNYALINIYCPRCKSVFYCDQACLKGHHAEHQKVCASLIQDIPATLETLQVEMHTSTNSHNITLYFEHEMKFSLRTRGIKMFAELKNKIMLNKLMKSYSYSVKEYKNSLEVTSDLLDPLYSPQRSTVMRAESFTKAISLSDYKGSRTPAERGPKPKEDKDPMSPASLFEEIMKDGTKRNLGVTNDDPQQSAKLPAVQEIKMMLLEMGGIVIDIIQERYPTKSAFVHIFMLP